MSEHSHPILIGCSGWSYPDWAGPFYPEAMEAGDFLEWYADRFPIVEVDSSFYRPPTPRMVRAWRDRTPDDFRFVLKVPRVITHEKMLRDCGEEVDGFLAAIAPLGTKIAGALLQMGYFNAKAFPALDAFLPVLDAFLGRWPHHRVPLVVETRNPRWVVPAFVAVLRDHRASLALTDQTWMPRPAEVARKVDPATGPLAMIRLLGDREAMEKVTTTWEKVVVDRADDLAEAAGLARSLAERVPAAIFASNHYAGHAPATARQLRRLLGQPEPQPPERPRTTLFD